VMDRFFLGLSTSRCFLNDKIDQLMSSVEKHIDHKIEQVIMYKRFHYLYYLYIVIKELIPIKIPKLIGPQGIFSKKK